MQSVDLISEVENSLGAFGYSVLQRGYNGSIKRLTLLFLRGKDGMAVHALIFPADVARGAF